MDPYFHGMVVLIWMLLSMSLGNCAISKSRVYIPKSRAWEVLDSMHGMYVVPLIWALGRRKNCEPRLFWIEPRQETQWNYVEPIIWRATGDMQYRKFIRFYRMSPEAFEHLVYMLTPYLKSQCTHLVRPQLEIRKIVAIVLYRFVHGHSLDHIADRLQVGGSTVRKYIDIVCDILVDRDKLFSHYISIPTGEQLESIISDFHDITGLPNICGAIDGTHISLAERPSHMVTHAQSDFFNRKKFHSIVLQGVCDAKRVFWNVCAGQPGGVHDGGQFKSSSLYQQLRDRSILQQPVVNVGGKMCTPYLIGDSAYPIRTYLQKNWRSTTDEGKKRYNAAMNSGRVVIEHAFGSLKNRWQILNSFNARVDRAARVSIACCWLHNYCELWKVPEPMGYSPQQSDPLVGFGNFRIPILCQLESAKAEGESLREKLYEQWTLENPIA